MSASTGFEFGRLLLVDLEKGQISERAVEEDVVRKYLGGSSLALSQITEGADLGVEPFDPGNPLAMVNGLLTGTGIPTSCKMSICACSPLTGLWSESTVGGYWPVGLKANGYDGIIFTGQAPEPVYLRIDDRGPSLESAGDLWGLDTVETDRAIRELVGAEADDDSLQVLSIGPAGEALVRYAAVMAGGLDGRAAGRTGMGAVMGSKRLKAVVVRGRERAPVADSNRVQEVTRNIVPTIRKNATLLHDFGTAGGVPTTEFTGDLPIKNWMQGSFTEGAAKISGQAQAETILASHYACFACPIRCGKEVQLRKGPHAGMVVSGPEYETCASYGSMVLVDDVDYVAWANDYANRQGLDTISSGTVVAMAMELSERGILTASDFGGFSPQWGDGESLMEVLRLIAERREVGRLLGEGVLRISKELGPLASEAAVHVKGLEVAYHDPRAFTSMAAVYGTANRGACHLEGLSYIPESAGFPASKLGLRDEWEAHGHEDKAQLAVAMQDYMTVFNALGLCKFMLRGQVGPDVLAGWLSGATGWEVDQEELLRTGTRLFNFRRLLNNALGISRKDDFLPPRLLTHDRKEGGAKGSLPHMGRLLSEYYAIRGWTEDGVPTRETLRSLQLEDLEHLLPPGSESE